MNTSQKSVALFLSTHDYRSRRKANVHFIARHISDIYETHFFSLGYSFLSRIKKDGRSESNITSNVVEYSSNVKCFLWKSWVHPFRLPRLDWAMGMIFQAYAKLAPDLFRQWVMKSDVIFVESGLAVAFINQVRNINPTAKIVYLASDDLATIGCSKFLITELAKTVAQIDYVKSCSPVLSDMLPSGLRIYDIPHGIDKSMFAAITSSPYLPNTRNVISVGSMLFDPVAVNLLVKNYPDISFHVIGAGKLASKLNIASNLTNYPEMPFSETLPFIQHADVGLAPYDVTRHIAAYLSDTSMKMLQYTYVGLPTVCPLEVSGGKPLRFGYVRDSEQSLTGALDLALNSERCSNVEVADWQDVAYQTIFPNEALLHGAK